MREVIFFFFSSRRRHTRWPRDWSSDVCSSDLEEIVHGHVLVLAPGRGAPPDGRLVESPPAVVEVLERAADREIARGADVAPAEVAREEPLGRPAAEAAHGGERLDDVLVRAASERGEVESARRDPPGEADDVL